LWPGKPLHQTFDLGELLIDNLKLNDGFYVIELEAIGAWWCWWSVDEVFDDRGDGGKRIEEGKEKEKEKEKFPEEVYKGSRPPIWLRSKDGAVVMIIEERIVCK
jgi:hypothetical protein